MHPSVYLGLEQMTCCRQFTSSFSPFNISSQTMVEFLLCLQYMLAQHLLEWWVYRKGYHHHKLKWRVENMMSLTKLKVIIYGLKQIKWPEWKEQKWSTISFQISTAWAAANLSTHGIWEANLASIAKRENRTIPKHALNNLFKID